MNSRWYGEGTYNQEWEWANAQGINFDYIIHGNSVMDPNVVKFISGIHRTQALMKRRRKIALPSREVLVSKHHWEKEERLIHSV